jgi:hypothetical protein
MIKTAEPIDIAKLDQHRLKRYAEVLSDTDRIWQAADVQALLSDEFDQTGPRDQQLSGEAVCSFLFVALSKGEDVGVDFFVMPQQVMTELMGGRKMLSTERLCSVEIDKADIIARILDVYAIDIRALCEAPNEEHVIARVQETEDVDRGITEL